MSEDAHSCNQPTPVRTRRLWPIERILFEANRVANDHWEKPIMVHSKQDLMQWLMNRYYQDRQGGL